MRIPKKDHHNPIIQTRIYVDEGSLQPADHTVLIQARLYVDAGIPKLIVVIKLSKPGYLLMYGSSNHSLKENDIERANGRRSHLR